MGANFGAAAQNLRQHAAKICMALGKRCGGRRTLSR